MQKVPHFHWQGDLTKNLAQRHSQVVRCIQGGNHEDLEYYSEGVPVVVSHPRTYTAGGVMTDFGACAINSKNTFEVGVIPNLGDPLATKYYVCHKAFQEYENGQTADESPSIVDYEEFGTPEEALTAADKWLDALVKEIPSLSKKGEQELIELEEQALLCAGPDL